ncbi:MAG: putative cytosol aminopeptidase, partial [Synergistales bacterium 58_81]
DPSGKIAFVGKGLTFDSGGLNIKPGDSMRSMKADKTGACNVIAIMKAVSERQEPAVMIDMATLTGACAVALGPYTAGIFGNDAALAASFREASGRTGERVWELPMDDERLKKKIRSEVADVVNSGGRYGGAITAAMFLREFVGEGIKWLHVDIAGVDSSDEEYGYWFLFSPNGSRFSVHASRGGFAAYDTALRTFENFSYSRFSMISFRCMATCHTSVKVL